MAFNTEFLPWWVHCAAVAAAGGIRILGHCRLLSGLCNR
jgi:hypothetical protein